MTKQKDIKIRKEALELCRSVIFDINYKKDCSKVLIEIDKVLEKWNE